jgi:thiamine pyrophosphate-dependent acetolactate synthase large subunit-like protein
MRVETGGWHRVDPSDVPGDGRVRSVTVDGRTVALARCGSRLGALENRVDERADGVHVRLPGIPERGRTVADVLVERLVSFGVSHVFGMVGHSNLGFADAMRRAEERGELAYIGIRHEGAAAFAASAYGKLTGRPAVCFAIAGPGSAVSAGLAGDAALTLDGVLSCLGTTRAEKARRAADDRGRGVGAAAVFAALSRQLPEDAVVTVDVGNHVYSLGRYLESKGQPVLMSGYLGSIGFGYPAALGAWAAAPGCPIVAVTGDGGFGQCAAELTTAVKHGIPVKHVLLDNHSLGKIGKEQLAAGFPVWHTTLHNPDWAAYAELCGATGIRADRREQLDAAMTRMFAADGPVLLHIEQDPELL